MDQRTRTTPHRESADALLDGLESSLERGLDAAEVRRRREEYGPNRLEEARARPTWRILIDQLASLIVLLLIAAAVAAAVFGRHVEAIAIGAAVLVNTVIGFTMELRATRAMDGSAPSPPTSWCPATSCCWRRATWSAPTCACWRRTGCSATRRRSPASPCPSPRAPVRSIAMIRRRRSASARTWPSRAPPSRTARA